MINENQKQIEGAEIHATKIGQTDSLSKL